MSDQEKKTKILPALPLRGITIFPGTLLNFDVERPMSVAAVNAALSSDQIIFLAAQRDVARELPRPDEICEIGTVCRVRQVLRSPQDKHMRVMAEGIFRGRALRYTEESPCYYAEVEPLRDVQEEKESLRTTAYIRKACGLFGEYVERMGNPSPEALLILSEQRDPGYVADYITQNVYLRHSDKQSLLEELDPSRRIGLLCYLLERENGVLALEQHIQSVAKEHMARSQKEYFLREQLRAIREELGEGANGAADEDDEIAEYRTKIHEANLPEEIENKLLKELTRLSKQPYSSAESSVLRGYLDTCLEMPWTVRSKDNVDIKRARKCLDEDHFGLDKVKDRVIEYLAIRQLAPEVKGGVLCLVGPPGVGKTSVAMSIARATNRKLARISLGGVHDEAEIRGHRKTYVGSMPGRIAEAMRQAGTSNPLMLLDEVDKVSSDYK
ncbi:MAG: LON peptidase substrate-binding domain-containing protein, partial [Eubacteriales bacterium]|nr:LON peptidase substrate-binding domain-containing protein [Eubacteriales bacterium]